MARMGREVTLSLPKGEDQRIVANAGLKTCMAHLARMGREVTLKLHDAHDANGKRAAKRRAAGIGYRGRLAPVKTRD